MSMLSCMYSPRARASSPAAMAARAIPGFQATQATPGVGERGALGLCGIARAPGVRPVLWGSPNGEFQPPGWHLLSFQTLT